MGIYPFPTTVNIVALRWQKPKRTCLCCRVKSVIPRHLKCDANEDDPHNCNSSQHVCHDYHWQLKENTYCKEYKFGILGVHKIPCRTHLKPFTIVALWHTYFACILDTYVEYKSFFFSLIFLPYALSLISRNSLLTFLSIYSGCNVHMNLLHRYPLC